MILTSISEELKSHTLHAHRQLEETVLPLIRNISEPSDYAMLLKIFYGFYAPLEARVSAALEGTEVLYDFNTRRKSSSIVDDLAALGFSSEEGGCRLLPEVSTPAHALGCVYVMEGSTLGGRAIAGMIGKVLPGAPFNFFLFYGADTKAKWESFKKNLDDVSAFDKEALLTAADQTFVLFKKWINEYPKQ